MAKKGFGGGMMPGNMNQILKQAQKMQDNMQKMQQELEAKEFEVSVGGGAVMCSHSWAVRSLISTPME